jgi:transcriptional regulator with XRE-family HTH domain
MVILEPDSYPQRALIGSRIRAARLGRGLTIKQVATSAGVTEGFLSRVERDLTSPSVATLVAICSALSVDIGDLLSQVEARQVSLDTAPKLANNDPEIIERLLTPRKEARIQVIHAKLGAGSVGDSANYAVNSPVHFVHILQGALELFLHDEQWQLKKADSLTFSGREPHRWKADSKTGATVLWFLAPATGE